MWLNDQNPNNRIIFNFKSQTPRKEHGKVQFGVPPCPTQDGERLFILFFLREIVVNY